MVNSTVGGATAASAYAAGIAANVIIANIGIGIGALIIVGSIYGASKAVEVFGATSKGLAGLLMPVVGIAAGVTLIVNSADGFGSNHNRLTNNTSKILNSTSDPARYYRFVRFLPDYLSGAALELTSHDNVASIDGGKTLIPAFASATSPKGTTVNFYSNVSDLYYESLKNASELVWEDSKTGKKWRFSSVPIHFQAAAAVCTDLGEFVLPLVSDIIIAKQDGMLSETSQFSERVPIESEFWVKSPDKVDRGTCPYSTLTAGRQYLTVECAQTKFVLCVSK